ncbi:MAG: hypothetical protein NVS1B11_36660 [Terriglobales bacterium]
MPKVEVIAKRIAIKPWGATWTMQLEKWFSASGKTSQYCIYHQCGQSYPVGTFRSLKKARSVLDSFSDYHA